MVWLGTLSEKRNSMTFTFADTMTAVTCKLLYDMMHAANAGKPLAGFDAAKHWLAVSSILLIIGAASVAVPLALRVAASK